MKTLRGRSQPPPYTPLLGFGCGRMRNSSVARSSRSTKWIQFTGHTSLAVYRSEERLSLCTFKLIKHSNIGNQCGAQHLLLICIPNTHFHQMLRIGPLCFHPSTTSAVIHCECFGCNIHTFTASCKKSSTKTSLQ